MTVDFSTFKSNWAPRSKGLPPQRTPRTQWSGGAPPPSLPIPSNIPSKWCAKTGDRVIPLPTMRPGTQQQPRGHGETFWQRDPAFNHPSRSHQGRRGVMVDAYLQAGTPFAGYKRCHTPPIKISGRDPTVPLTRSKSSLRLDSVIVKDSVNGRPLKGFGGVPTADEARCGPAIPPGFLASNLVAMQARPHGFTSDVFRFMDCGGPVLEAESQKALDGLPLYSSFGLPSSPQVKQFDPSVFMPRKWKSKLSARVQALTPSASEAFVEIQESGQDDAFSPGVGGWTQKGSLRRDSIGDLEGVQMVQSPDKTLGYRSPDDDRRGSVACRRGSTNS